MNIQNLICLKGKENISVDSCDDFGPNPKLTTPAPLFFFTSVW